MADTRAEVYETNDLEGAPESGWVLAGCAYGSRRSHVFGSVSSGSGSGGGSDEPITLVGTMLATRSGSYSTVGWGPEHTSGISVTNLRSGRKIREWNTTEGAGIASAVLKPDGALAWITASYVNGESGSHQESVYADDSGGLRLLARGSDIQEDSLALGGSIVYWTEGGTAHSATLN